MIYLKQSTASQEVPLGYFVNSTDGDTAETALTIANTDIKVWKTGATTLANKNSGGATHISGGIYYAVMDATDTDTLGSLVIFVHVSGALSVRLECCVLAANIYDSLIGGGDVLDVSTTQFNGSNVTAASGVPEVKVQSVANNAITAASLAADAGGELADAVWDEALAGHVTAGTAGKALTDAGSAGDPWATAIPGAYIAGSAGFIVGTNVNATISSRSTVTTAQVNTEVVDALNVDTYAEPGQGSPAATASLAAKIGYLFKSWRNKKTQTSTTFSLFADDATTVDQKSTTTDDGSTGTRGEMTTGP